MPLAASERLGPAPRPRGAGRMAVLTSGLRGFGRCRRALINGRRVAGHRGVLGFLPAGRLHEFAAAISDAAVWVPAVTVLPQTVAPLARSEAWGI